MAFSEALLVPGSSDWWRQISGAERQVNQGLMLMPFAVDIGRLAPVIAIKDTATEPCESIRGDHPERSSVEGG